MEGGMRVCVWMCVQVHDGGANEKIFNGRRGRTQS